MALPESGLYKERQRLAQLAYEQAKARIQRQRTQMMTQYGYNQDGSVDAHNPYGLYQQQRRQHGMQNAGLQSNLASRGILGNMFEGGGSAARERLMFDQGVGRTNMAREFSNSMADFADAEQQSGLDYQREMYEAQKEALAEAMANRDYGPAPGPGDTPGSPSTTPTVLSLVRKVAKPKNRPTRRPIGGWE